MSRSTASTSKGLTAERVVQYARLMRLHRPIGIFLLLWPTLWALWIAAEGWPDPWVLTVFVLGVVLMRSAGCVINDYADRHIDPHVLRTLDRPLATGAVSPREALGLFLLLLVAAFLLVLTLNALTILLALVGALLAGSYPFMKRYTHLPQFHLGLAFGWAVPMAFAAQTNALPPVAWLLLIATVLWAVVYDTMYAMVDRDDDLKLGVKSTAILFGDLDRVIIGTLQLLLLASLVLVGRTAGLGAWYYLGLGLGAVLGVYHQYLIRDRSPEGCFRAFLHNNWLGGAVFASIALHYTFAP